jgi:hypothetical protein
VRLEIVDDPYETTNDGVQWTWTVRAESGEQRKTTVEVSGTALAVYKAAVEDGRLPSLTPETVEAIETRGRSAVAEFVDRGEWPPATISLTTPPGR